MERSAHLCPYPFHQHAIAHRLGCGKVVHTFSLGPDQKTDRTNQVLSVDPAHELLTCAVPSAQTDPRELCQPWQHTAQRAQHHRRSEQYEPCTVLIGSRRGSCNGLPCARNLHAEAAPDLAGELVHRTVFCMTVDGGGAQLHPYLRRMLALCDRVA